MDLSCFSLLVSWLSILLMCYTCSILCNIADEGRKDYDDHHNHRDLDRVDVGGGDYRDPGDGRGGDCEDDDDDDDEEDDDHDDCDDDDDR